MELDDFKKAGEREIGSLDQVKSDLRQYDRSLKRHFVIESLVAGFSLIAVVAMIFGGDVWYAYVISELLPDTSRDIVPTLNFPMYAGMVLMALYCVTVPVKRYVVESADASLSWTLASRIDSEIARMEKQKRLWSTAHLWSIAPAATIGVLFFWGLNKSLTMTWVPSIYLWIYFAVVALSSVAGVWLMNKMVTRNVQPLLTRLHGVRNELRAEVA